QQPTDERMRFESLQHVLRINARISIVQAGDVAQGNNVVFRSVNPSATIFFGGKRPAHGVDDLAFFDRSRWNFPQLFYANTVDLGIAVLLQVKFVDQLLGQRSAWSFGQNRDLRLEVVARFEVRFLLVLFVDAFVIGADTGYFVAVKKQLRSGKA